MTFDPEKVLGGLRSNQARAPSSKSSRSSSKQHLNPTTSNRGGESATLATLATRPPTMANPADGRTYTLLSRAFREHGIVVRVSGRYIDMSSHTEPPDGIVNELIEAKPDIIRVLGDGGISADNLTQANWQHDHALIHHRVKIALSGRTLAITKEDGGEPPISLIRRIEALQPTFHRLLPSVFSERRNVTDGPDVTEGYSRVEGERPGVA